MDMVPPTVEVRTDKGEVASLQLWIENVKTLKQVQDQKLKAPDTKRWNFQLHRAYVFDDLVGNIDENAGNLLFDPEWNFIKIDHSRAFTNTLAEPFEIGKRFTQIDREFYERVKALDRTTLARELGNLVDQPGALQAMMARHDNIVKEFEKLLKDKGEAQVFVP
jgi:hypothetical protein